MELTIRSTAGTKQSDMVGKPLEILSLVHACFFDITSRTKDIMGHSFLSLQYIFYVFLHKYGNGLN